MIQISFVLFCQGRIQGQQAAFAAGGKQVSDKGIQGNQKN